MKKYFVQTKGLKGTLVIPKCFLKMSTLKNRQSLSSSRFLRSSHLAQPLIHPSPQPPHRSEILASRALPDKNSAVIMDQQSAHSLNVPLPLDFHDTNSSNSSSSSDDTDKSHTLLASLSTSISLSAPADNNPGLSINSNSPQLHPQQNQKSTKRGNAQKLNLRFTGKDRAPWNETVKKTLLKKLRRKGIIHNLKSESLINFGLVLIQQPMRYDTFEGTKQQQPM